jgi:TRAP-type C4-dicarboxylate transport system substrate-binding protein
MLRRSLITAPMLAATLPRAANAQAATEWRFHNSYAPARTESVDVRAFVDDVNRLAPAGFKMTLFEGNAMNLRDADALRWMQAGTPEMGFIWPPFLGRDAPDLASLYVYGSVSGAAEHLRAMPALRRAMGEGLAKWNIELVGIMPLTILAGTIFAREPLTTLDQLKRRKLRVGTREQVETFSALGVAAQIVPQQELYTAMQTGVVDCAFYPQRIAQTVSLQEVAKHVVDTGFPFPPVPYAIMAHQAKWRALPAPNRAAITEAMKALETRATRFDADAAAETAAQERLKATGVTFHGTFNEADQRAIRTAALATWDKITKEAGGQAPAWRARIVQAIGA